MTYEQEKSEAYATAQEMLTDAFNETDPVQIHELLKEIVYLEREYGFQVLEYEGLDGIWPMELDAESQWELANNSKWRLLWDDDAEEPYLWRADSELPEGAL